MTKNDFLNDRETLKTEKPEKAELFAMLEEEATSQPVTAEENIPSFSDIQNYEGMIPCDAFDEDGEDNPVQKAVEFATVAHAGAVRKGTDIPYIVHPMDVMKIVAGITDDEEIRAAAVLHDTVEDTDVTGEDIEEVFGERIAELVAAESENKREDQPEETTWKIRKQETLDHLAEADTDAKIICLGDKLSNMRDIARDYESIGDKLWERFNAPEDENGISGKKANIGWYYRGIADRLKSELGDTDAWHELDGLIVKIFGLEAKRSVSEKAELIGYNKQLEDAISAEAYWFDKEEAGKLLEAAEACNISDVTDEMYYTLDPLAVIDTDKIIEDWKSGWSESYTTEEWKLEAYPVMPDGTVQLLFSMDDEICGGKIDALKTVHVGTYFRVLHYKLGSNGPEIINKYRFSLQDCKVGTVFIRDSRLYATVAMRNSGSYTVLQVFPGDDDDQFPIGTYIKDVVPRTDGNTVVSYFDNQNDKQKAPVSVFNAEGEVAGNYIEQLAISCKAMTMDADENIWYHCYPSGEITEIRTDNEFGESHRVELQGFNAFAFSDDKSVLVAEFSEHNSESIIFVMHQDNDGDYGAPVRFAFEPKDDDDNVIESEDCEYYGCPSICKATMLLRADGRLYWYDVNAF